MTVGVCPVCNGAKRVPCPEHLKGVGVLLKWYNYDSQSDTIPCQNCGGQYHIDKYVCGEPTGVVVLQSNGVPCTHEYESANKGRQHTEYKCVHCGDTYITDFNY
jgi:transcription elongation factor Elf1